jgi:hypothetical protein
LTPQVSSSLSLVSPFLLILISWFGSIVSNAEPLKKTKNQKITFGFYLGFAGARSRRSVIIWGGYPTSQFDSHSIFFSRSFHKLPCGFGRHRALGIRCRLKISGSLLNHQPLWRWLLRVEYCLRQLRRPKWRCWMSRKRGSIWAIKWKYDSPID